MKKSIIFMFMLVLVVLTGCYYDNSKKDMEVTGIKVYDENNQEIIGIYKDYYRGINNISTTSKTIFKENLNSAAPVLNYYFIEAKNDQSYKVEFYLKSEKKLELTKLSLINELNNSYPDETIEVLDIKKNDNEFIATIIIDKITTDNQIYTVHSWFNLQKENKFREQGSNTYICGVYFQIKTESEV